MPQHIAKELTENARQLAHIENNPNSPRYLLKDWHDFAQTNQETAKALSKLLLTNDANFRKSFDHHVGLLSSACSPDEYKRIKMQAKNS